MDAVGMIIGILISTAVFVGACCFFLRQRSGLAAIRADLNMPPEQRIFLVNQCRRRHFGAALLVALACLVFGSVFLDYDPHRMSEENVPQVSEATARAAVSFISFYLMAMLLVLMAILMIAVVDFWALARFNIRQQRQLIREHQEVLEAELAAHLHRSRQTS